MILTERDGSRIGSWIRLKLEMPVGQDPLNIA